MRSRWLLAWLAIGSATPSVVPAQSVMSVEAGPSIVGDGSLMQLGVRFSGITANRPTADFAVATLVEFLDQGFLGLTDFGLAIPVALGPDARLLPRFGLSGLLGVGSGGGALAPGFHVGIGALALLGQRSGVRIDYTLRHLTYDGESAGWGSLTFGFTFGT